MRPRGELSRWGLPLDERGRVKVGATLRLYQLPLLNRKLRVVVDWTAALFFRRDIAELGTLGHRRRLD